MSVPIPPINPLTIPPLSWLTRIPGLRGFLGWSLYLVAWASWTLAGYLVYNIPGALAVFGAGALMTSYVVSPTLR